MALLLDPLRMGVPSASWHWVAAWWREEGVKLDELIARDGAASCSPIGEVDGCCLTCMSILGGNWPAGSQSRSEWEKVALTHAAHKDNYQKQCDRNGWVKCPYCLKGYLP